MAKVNVPSSAIFPFCISNYAGSLLIFEDTASMLASNETLFFLWDKNEKEEERGMIKKKRDIDKKKERSIISNREKVLSRQQTASPLSLSLSHYFSLPLIILLLVCVPTVYPDLPQQSRPFINAGSLIHVNTA